jgi:hypothetical protein
MKLTQKQKDDLLAVLYDDDLERLATERPLVWSRLAKMVGFWGSMIAIPFIILWLLPPR